MYKRYYDGYGPIYQRNTGNRGEVVIPRETESESIKSSENEKNTDNATGEILISDRDTKVIQGEQSSISSIGGIGKIFEDIAIDDIILFAVILLVLKDSQDDPLLIIILTVVFLSGLLDKG